MLRALVNRPAMADAALAVLLAGIAILQLGMTDERFPDPRGFDVGGFWAHAFLIAIIAPVAVRSRAPRAAFSVSTVAVVVAAFVGVYDTNTEALAHAVLLYTVVAQSSARWSLIAALGAAAVLLTHLPPWIDGIIPAFAYNTFLYGLVWAAGRAQRERGELARGLDLRNAQLERERELLAREALETERHRIAVELERVVAHAITRARGDVAQARRALAGAAPERDAAIAAVERVGREALDEVQRLVSLLRGAEDREAPDPALNGTDGSWRRLPGTAVLRSVVLVAVAGVTLALELDELAGRFPPGAPTPLDDEWFLVAMAIGVSALLVRLASPLLACVLVAAVILFGRFAEPLVLTTTILVVQIIVTYSLALRADRRIALAAVIAGSLVWLPGIDGLLGLVVEMLFRVVSLGFAVLLGLAVREREGLVASLDDRRALLERTRDERARLAVEQERLRVAREMHDSVGHALTLMVMHAGVARRHADRGGPVTEEALDEVERLVDQVGEELGALHDDAPPSVGGLPELVQQAAAAGVDVDLEVHGEPRPLGDGLEFALYRITQEALTNVGKHAQGATATVALRYQPECVELGIVNDASTAVAAGLPSGGNGLVAIRERATMYGGVVHAGPRPSGGFAVSVRIPVGE